MNKIKSLIRFFSAIPWIIFLGIMIISVVLSIDPFELPEELRDFDRIQDNKLGKAGEAFSWMCFAATVFVSLLLWFERLEGVWIYAVLTTSNYFFEIFTGRITIQSPVSYVFADILSTCLAMAAMLVWIFNRYNSFFQQAEIS